MRTKSCASSALGTVIHKFPVWVSLSSHVCLQVFMGEPLRFSELSVISCSIFTLVPALVIATLSYTVDWICEQMAPNYWKQLSYYQIMVLIAGIIQGLLHGHWSKHSTCNNSVPYNVGTFARHILWIRKLSIREEKWLVMVICRIGLRSGKEPKPRSSFAARHIAFTIKYIEWLREKWSWDVRHLLTSFQIFVISYFVWFLKL